MHFTSDTALYVTFPWVCPFLILYAYFNFFNEIVKTILSWERKSPRSPPSKLTHLLPANIKEKLLIDDWPDLNFQELTRSRNLNFIQENFDATNARTDVLILYNHTCRLFLLESTSKTSYKF